MKMTSNKNYFTLLWIAFLLVIISLTNISEAKKVKTLGSQAQIRLADGKTFGFRDSCPSIKLDLKTFILEAECKGNTGKYSKISTLDLNKCFRTKIYSRRSIFAQDLSNPGFKNDVDINSCKFDGTQFTCQDKNVPLLFYHTDLNIIIGNLDGVMNLKTCKAQFVEQINN
jgi:hypothetical protein